MTIRKLILLMFLIASPLINAQVNAQEFKSGSKQVPMIELYTSEGCSSCPPADKWLSSLKSRDDIFEGFVPLAFHVDYWDYIGWKDPYASPEYSQRQRQYAREQNERTVYTPGVRKTGEEWRTWRLWGGPTIENAAEVGALNVEFNEIGEFKAGYDGLISGDMQLTIAVLGLDLESQVNRGENKGKTLKHDFVVLGLSRFASIQKTEWSGQIGRPEIYSKKYAIAAWLSEKGSVKPVQVVGGYLASNTWVSPL